MNATNIKEYKERNNKRRDEDKPELREAVDDIYRLLGYTERLQSQLAQVAQERKIAVRYLSKQGYARCDQPEHGCDGWHERLAL